MLNESFFQPSERKPPPLKPGNMFTLNVKWDFVDVIKVGIMRWDCYPGLSKQAQCSHKGLCKREARGSNQRERDVMTEQRLDYTRKTHRTKKANGLRKLEKARKHCLLNPPVGAQSSNTLILRLLTSRMIVQYICFVLSYKIYGNAIAVIKN